MDYISPEFNNMASMLTSPVLTPVPYATSLEFFDDSPTNADTNIPGKDQHSDIFHDGKL
jgi:hypothetical protein